MASTINATTTSGIAIGGDTSGAIALQKDGTTYATGNQYGIGLGTAVPSSGIGITFPATQSASSDANTLDDYEEGSWTPVLGASTTNPTTSYDAQAGSYTKIGRFVNIQCYIQTSARSGGSGTVQITGLPFVAANQSQSYCGVVASQSANLTGVSYAGIRSYAGASYLEVMVNATATRMDVTNWSATGTILVTLSYIV